MNITRRRAPGIRFEFHTLRANAAEVNANLIYAAAYFWDAGIKVSMHVYISVVLSL